MHLLENPTFQEMVFYIPSALLFENGQIIERAIQSASEKINRVNFRLHHWA
jgi:hypothetical protein